MAIRPEDLPKDPAALAEMVLAFDGENDDLRAEIATLKGLIFGARSERSAIVCAEQLALDLEQAAAAPPPANDDEPESDAPKPKRRKARRNIGADRAHRRGQVRLAVDALSSDANPRGPGGRRRPSDAGALDGKRGLDGPGPLRC